MVVFGQGAGLSQRACLRVHRRPRSRL